MFATPAGLLSCLLIFQIPPGEGIQRLPDPIPQDLSWGLEFASEGNGDTTRIYTAIECQDGGILFAGGHSFAGSSDNQFWIGKVDRNGNRLGEVHLGGPDYDYANSLIETHDRGFLVAGYNKSHGAGGTEPWISRVGPKGQLLWQKSFGGSDHDNVSGLLALQDGGFLVVGNTKSFAHGSYDLWVLRLDFRGEILWERTYGGEAYETGRAAVTTPDGNLLLAGTTSSYGPGGTDIWVLKLDLGGNVLWETTYGTAAHTDSVYSLVADPDGGYFLGGYTSPFADRDFLIMKIGEEGSLVWQKIYGDSTVDNILRQLVLTADGNLLATGYSTTSGGGFGHILLLHLDKGGNPIWEKHLDGTEPSTLYSPRTVLATSDGGIVIGGYTYYGTGSWNQWEDAFLLKLNGDGSYRDCALEIPGTTLVQEGNLVTQDSESVHGASAAIVTNTADTGTPMNSLRGPVCSYWLP